MVSVHQEGLAAQCNGMNDGGGMAGPGASLWDLVLTVTRSCNNSAALPCCVWGASDRV